MFDIGFAELMVIGVVSLIVVGPKDLPGMFRTVGRYVGKAKSMAREFQRSMEDAADATGIKDVTSDLKNMASGLDDIKTVMNPSSYGTKKAKEEFKKILDAKDTGIPVEKEDPEAEDDKEFADDYIEDDPVSETGADVDKEVAKPNSVKKPKPKAKSAAKPKAKAKPKAAAKPKPKSKVAKPKVSESKTAESSQT